MGVTTTVPLRINVDKMVKALYNSGSYTSDWSPGVSHLSHTTEAVRKGCVMCALFSSVTSWSLPRAKSLTRDEVTRILDAAKQRDAIGYVFFATAANTALRLCEVLHLRKADLEDGRIRITRRKKKRLAPEWIDVVPALWNILKEWGQMFEDDDFVFPGKASACFIHRRNGKIDQACSGGHASKRNMQRKWMLALKDCGLSMAGRGVHSLRHFAVTEFYSNTRDLRASQLFAGHSSSFMTERYAHVVDMKERVYAIKSCL